MNTETPIKLLMTWNIRPASESEYSEFVVNEFIPRMTRLGLDSLDFWYTRYGDCKQIQASGVAPTMTQMQHILDSEEWQSLQDMLSGYIVDYNQKLVRAGNGFQF